MQLLRESTFEYSVNAFKQFLSEQDAPVDLRWVFQEDFRKKEQNMIVVNSNPEKNSKLAEQLYEVGRTRALGMCFQAIGRADSQLYCYVEVPRDADEAERLMFDSSYLKLSIRNPLLEVLLCPNTIVWHLKSLGSDFPDEVPSSRQESWR